MKLGTALVIFLHSMKREKQINGKFSNLLILILLLLLLISDGHPAGKPVLRQAAVRHLHPAGAQVRRSGTGRQGPSHTLSVSLSAQIEGLENLDKRCFNASLLGQRLLSCWTIHRER